MQRQDVLANNLANASTTGFRAELAAFRAVPVRGDGASTRVYALEIDARLQRAPGPVAATGRNLDVAMKGNAWLAVQGRTAPRPTRAAARSTSTPRACWSRRGGLPVLGDGGPITMPANARGLIAGDGTVTATVGNGAPAGVGRHQAGHARGADGARRRRPVPRRRR
jgi:flagellar basal-body rod protein FlgF